MFSFTQELRSTTTLLYYIYEFRILWSMLMVYIMFVFKYICHPTDCVTFYFTGANRQQIIMRSENCGIERVNMVSVYSNSRVPVQPISSDPSEHCGRPSHLYGNGMHSRFAHVNSTPDRHGSSTGTCIINILILS